MAKLASLMLFARTLGEELSERCSGKVLLLRLASPAHALNYISATTARDYERRL